MEITFSSEKLKRQCESTGERKKSFGAPAAKTLKTRLDDLDAATCMDDMRHLPGRWEELTGDRKGHFSCRLDKALRLILRPMRQPPPTRPEGGMDWAAIDKVTVTEVVNYHG